MDPFDQIIDDYAEAESLGQMTFNVSDFDETVTDQGKQFGMVGNVAVPLQNDTYITGSIKRPEPTPEPTPEPVQEPVQETVQETVPDVSDVEENELVEEAFEKVNKPKRARKVKAPPNSPVSAPTKLVLTRTKAVPKEKNLPSTKRVRKPRAKKE